jgi:hypothetical protein
MLSNDNAFTALLDTLVTWWCPAGTGVKSQARSMPFPHRPTVYLLLDTTPRGGALIKYVGQTQDLRVRLAQHNANPRMCTSHWDTVWWLDPGIPELSQRLQLETILMCAALPELNRAVMLVKTKQGRLAEVRFGQRSQLARAVHTARADKK